jgi:hypothetical protein
MSKKLNVNPYNDKGLSLILRNIKGSQMDSIEYSMVVRVID